MPFPQFTSNPQITIPSAADSIAVPASGAAWTNGAWTQIVASLAKDSILTGISFISPNASADSEFELDIGVGTSVKATIKGETIGVLGGVDSYYQLPIPVDAFPSGSQIQARVRRSTTDTENRKVALTILQKPISGSLITTAQPSKVLPSAAGLIVINFAGSWGTGTWTEITPGLGVAIVVAGIIMRE